MIKTEYVFQSTNFQLSPHSFLRHDDGVDASDLMKAPELVIKKTLHRFQLYTGRHANRLYHDLLRPWKLIKVFVCVRVHGDIILGWEDPEALR
jgi:hypothetical protein